jgi:hypothetical protein
MMGELMLRIGVAVSAALHSAAVLLVASGAFVSIPRHVAIEPHDVVALVPIFVGHV